MKDVKKSLLILAVLGLALMMLMPLNVQAAIPGDMNDDGNVNLTDIILAVQQYDLLPGDPGYNATIAGKADLAAPYGTIDIFDLVTIVFYYTG